MSTTFDRPTIKAIHADINAALQAVSNKYGIHLDTGTLSFTPTELSVKVKGINLSQMTGASNAVVPTHNIEQAMFNKYCMLFGLKVSDYGRKFVTHGRTFTISNIKPNKRKYPIVAKSDRGTSYIFEASTVLAGLI